MAKPDGNNYRSMKAELDQILIKLREPDVDIEEALSQYKRGLELVNQLEKYLKSAKNEVKKIKARFSG